MGNKNLILSHMVGEHSRSPTSSISIDLQSQFDLPARGLELRYSQAHSRSTAAAEPSRNQPSSCA